MRDNQAERENASKGNKKRIDKSQVEKSRDDSSEVESVKPRKSRDNAGLESKKSALPEPSVAVTADAVSEGTSLLDEIKRKVKQELIAELRRELQEELREELKQELGLSSAKKNAKSSQNNSESAPAETTAENRTESSRQNKSRDNRNRSADTEKKTTSPAQAEGIEPPTVKKKAVLEEDRNNSENTEIVELVDANQKKQGKFKKIPITTISAVVPKEPVELESARSVDSQSETAEIAAPIQKKSSEIIQKSVVPELSTSESVAEDFSRKESSSSEESTQETPAKKQNPKKETKKSKKSTSAKEPKSKQDSTGKQEVADKQSSANKQESTAKQESPADAKAWADSKFHQFNLKPEIMRALHEFDYLEPTPIQQGVIPIADSGKDVMGQAQTGTGKTAAFALPILQNTEFDENQFAPRALILVPTRELAVQVRDEIKRLGKYTGLTIAAFYGGAPIQKQMLQLSDGVDVAVGTPGRVIDLFTRRSLDLSHLKFVVLDEADRMLDIGFRPDIEKILRRCPDSRQTLLLSATIPSQVDALARHYMTNPEKLDFSPKNLSVDTIEQFYFSVVPEKKVELLKKLLEREQPHQAIIFCRTKKRTEQLTNLVKRWFPDADGMHGDLDQGKRLRIISKFREGKIRILVATDVVGRGLDISGISHIINYDIPQFCDDYVHRVGRTGRMGHEGVAYTFVTAEEGVELTRIEMRINRLLKRDEIPGFVAFTPPVPSVIPAESDKFHADDAHVSEEAPKPVFGKPTRRIRRAL